MVADGRSTLQGSELRYECPDAAWQRKHDGGIERRVLAYLSFRGIEGLDLLTLRVISGNVVLDGIVPSLSEKRRLCECCRHVAGVLNVIDRIVVLPRLCNRSPKPI